MRTGAAVEIIVYPPSSEEGKRELERRAAMIHADLVRARIDHLSCPAAQKTELLDRIIDTVEAQIKL